MRFSLTLVTFSDQTFRAKHSIPSFLNVHNPWLTAIWSYMEIHYRSTNDHRRPIITQRSYRGSSWKAICHFNCRFPNELMHRQLLWLLSKWNLSHDKLNSHRNSMLFRSSVLNFLTNNGYWWVLEVAGLWTWVRFGNWPLNYDFIIFSCDQAALWMVQSVRPSVCLSVRPSVTPFWLCSHHPIIMKFSGVITSDKSDVHAKGQGQRSKVKVTEVTTQLNRFRTVTPV